MRFLLATFLLVAPAGFFGCARMEPPVRTPVPAAVESAEPNEVSVDEPPKPAAIAQEPNEAKSEPREVQEPVAAAVERTETSVQAPEKMPDPNESAVGGPDDKMAEPNTPEVAEPPKGASPPAEPDHATIQASEGGAGAAFRERYAEILKTYVREDGLVDYGSLRRRRLDLKAILAELDELDASVYEGWSGPEKLAFWINAFNLKMLDIIAKNYPIESSWWLRLTWPPSDIRHIEGVWTGQKFIVMEEEFTLAEVEQRFFHRTFDDPRVYLALTYACQSSPPLRREPYRGDDLDRQLDDQVRRFLSSPQGLQIDRRNMVVRLSALFKPSWRGKEFVSRYGTDKKFKSRDPQTRAALTFIANYLPREDVEFLEVENYSLEYMNFDWRLNDTAKGY